jgi:hypothetical protein
MHPEINTADLSGLEKEGWGTPSADSLVTISTDSL